MKTRFPPANPTTCLLSVGPLLSGFPPGIRRIIHRFAAPTTILAFPPLPGFPHQRSLLAPKRFDTSRLKQKISSINIKRAHPSQGTPYLSPTDTIPDQLPTFSPSTPAPAASRCTGRPLPSLGHLLLQHSLHVCSGDHLDHGRIFSSPLITSSSKKHSCYFHCNPPFLRTYYIHENRTYLPIIIKTRVNIQDKLPAIITFIYFTIFIDKNIMLAYLYPALNKFIV